MENYYFVYKNQNGSWSSAANPMFIAKHQHCRALPKHVVNENLCYNSLSDLIFDMNYYETGKKFTYKQIQILIEFDILL